MEKQSYALIFAALAAGTAHGQDLRSATADNLNVTGAWTDGSVPTAADIATWNASSTLANTIGAGQTYGGLNVSAAAGAVSIAGAFNLTLDHSTDANTVFNTGANNFTWGADGTAGTFNIVGALSAVAPGNGNTGIGATFAGSGITTISGTGTKNWSISGSATNGANGVTNLAFTGTLRLRGASTAIETLGGNWLALGGGGGSTGVPGNLIQTGAFNLDTGDATSRGDFILTQAFNDQTLQLASLSGTGNLRSDWGVGATVSNRAVRINQATDTVFAGGIYGHNGSGQRRNVTVTKEGAGKLTFTGRLGTSQSAAGNPSLLNFAINGGVWQMGDGTENPSAPLNPVNWDSASTFTIGSAGTLRFMANETEYTWDRPLDGSGLLEITNDGSAGEGNVALTANSPAFTGATHVLAGKLRLGGDLSGSAVTVSSGARLAVGTPATPGTGIVKSLALASGSSSTFRAGIDSNSDQIFVDGSGGFSVAGPHVITAVFAGGLNQGDRATLIDYTGSFTGFANLSLAPGSRFTLINNTAETSIQLEYTGGTLVWTGGDGNWNLNTTPNWKLGANAVTFLTGDSALFNDTASTGNVVVTGTQTPSSVTIDNDSRVYSFSGGTIGGIGDFTKQGSAAATVASATSYSGTTYVSEGSLTFGDGATSGEIGSGPVDIQPGATLRINRSDLLDYKTSARLRTVSGSGDVVIDGGGTLFNYPGGALAFDAAGTWSAFSGNLIVKGNSEFQTIRNGATAMGSGDIVLGDATTSGNLSQIEGNWTWTNDIIVTGSANHIYNRSVNGPRTLKLQGIISGSGGLSFTDAAATMTNLQAGFILTGENSFSGPLAISPGTPLRVGGVPGNTDVSQSAAAASGSLGTSTVTNEGYLTFSRTDAHSVANSISGPGEVYVGLDGDAAGQVVSFTGSKTYSGPTTVRDGTLLLNTGLPNSPVVVQAAGTLGGSGTLGSASSISGTLAPGAGVGTLSSTADIALENGSKIAWQASNWTGAAGSGYDTVNAATLTIGASAATPAVVVITQESLVNFSETAKTFTLASTSAGISGFTAGSIIVDATNAPGTGTWSVQVTGNKLELSYALGTGNAYNAWESLNGIAGAGVNADSDQDGIPNGIEFVIGGDPSGPNSDSHALLLPPVVTATSLTYVFRRSDESAGFNPFVEYGSNLTGWTQAMPGVNGVTITEDNNFYSGNIDRVTVVIPRALATGSTLFARLRLNLP